jgi:hypothetical protein
MSKKLTRGAPSKSTEKRYTHSHFLINGSPSALLGRRTTKTCRKAITVNP